MIPNIFRNTSRDYLLQFAQEAASSLPSDSIMLDAGAGDAPYRHLFSNVQYESADFSKVDKEYYDDITYTCNLQNIPVDDNRYDLILLTQVLEHLPEPKLVLKELHRILKPNGTIWLSAPLFFHEHEIPYDFYRYTQFGLTHLLESSGFQIERIEWLEGYYGTLAFQLRRAARYLPLFPKSYGGGVRGLILALFANLFRVIAVGFAAMFGWLDARVKITDTGLCKNYVAVARKVVS